MCFSSLVLGLHDGGCNAQGLYILLIRQLSIYVKSSFRSFLSFAYHNLLLVRVSSSIDVPLILNASLPVVYRQVEDWDPFSMDMELAIGFPP